MLPAVPSRADACSRRQPGHGIGQQTRIGHAIATKAKQFRNHVIEAARAIRRQRMAAQAELRLLLPLAPQQAQMGEIELVRQERQQALGMKLGEADAVRCCGVGSDKQRQEVLVNFDG